MTEFGEMIAAFEAEIAENCPFKDEIVDSKVSSEEEEGIENDDREAVQAEQANNGGTLGKNLENKSAGKKGTVGGPYPPDDYLIKEAAQDSKRGDKGRVHVAGAGNFPDGPYPFVVAAHHLIPGKASLKPSALKPYMTAEETVTSKSGKSWKIACHIGYNVNGSHNGVWLAGNYAIRTSGSTWHATPQKGSSWKALESHPWCVNYVASVCKVTGRQFHDTHTEYNKAAKKILNKISTALFAHQDACEICAKKANGKISPPYLVKQRLYNISKYLRDKVKGSPQSWKRPWFTSDRWRDEVFQRACGKIAPEFIEAFNKAYSTKE